MAIIAVWNGDGLADGTPVTTSTAGPGDTPFGLATGGAAVISASGSRPPRIQVDQQANTTAQFIWRSGVFGTRTAYAVRGYLELTAYPSVGTPILNAYGAGDTALRWRLDVTSAGIVRLRDASNTIVATAPSAIPIGVELRVEVVINSGAATARIYQGNSTSAPLVDLAGTVGASTDTSDSLRLSNPQTTPIWPRHYWDTIALSDTPAEIGPPAGSSVEGTGTITATAATSSSGVKVGMGTGSATAETSVTSSGAKHAAGAGAIAASAVVTGTGVKSEGPSGTGTITVTATTSGTGVKAAAGAGSASTASSTTAAGVKGAAGTGSAGAAATSAGQGAKRGMGTATVTATATSSGTGEARGREAEGTGRITATASVRGRGHRVKSFPSARLDVLVEINVGGVWTNITKHAFVRDPITIEHGRADEGAQADPAKLSLTINNRDGRYSPRNPLSPYYGKIGRNTPIRVSVPDGAGGRAYRFVGEVSEWPTRWTVGGHDVWVPISAAGISRRLGQGAKPLRSALTRALSSVSPRLAGYWPLEDGTTSTQVASALTGDPPMRITGPVQFGSEGAPPGGAGAADFSQGGMVSARVVQPTIGGWTVSFVLTLPDAIEAEDSIPVVGWTTPGAGTYVQYYVTALTGSTADAGSLMFYAYTRDGLFETPQMVTRSLLRETALVTLHAQQQGSNIRYTWYVNGVVQGVPGVPGTATLTDTAGAVATISVNDLSFLGSPGWTSLGQVSHLVVAGPGQLSAVHAAAVPALTAYAGELAGARVTRLAGEEGVPLQLVGATGDTPPMGPQAPRTLLELVGECADADGGMLHDRRDAAALRYRTRAADYNTTPTLVLPYSTLAADLEPIDDDQLIRNDITVERDGGSSARVVQEDGPLSVQDPPLGVGQYEESVTLNVASDDQLADIAAWRLHLGTVDEARFPVVTLKLHRQPQLIPGALATDVRSRIRLTDLPPWLPPGPIDQIVNGYRETLEPLRWVIEYNCVPGSPWHVGAVGDTTLGRADTDGAVLLADAGAADTALMVATTAGPYWTTDPGETPFEVTLGGEVVRVTAVDQAIADGFDRTVTNGWGTAPDGRAWTTYGTSSHFSVSGSAARMTIPARGVADVAALSLGAPAVDVETVLTAPAAPVTGDALYTYLIGHFDQQANNWYALVVGLFPDGTLGALFEVKTAGVTSGLTTLRTIPGVTVAAGTWYRVRLRIQGGRLDGKVWADGTPEPDWHISAFDSRHTRGDVGVQAYVPPANTNTLPVAFQWREVIVHNPQRMTVVRAVNGITKPHTAGADVRLAQPAITAL
ncbi:hypothetical protein [Actinomadura miaoliensis]|uniref:Minor tail protein n=1 Tax=Actinomadura miaoliensis TaxID=430685 RepID=A0ABP7V5S9_9ACTN